jgi:hypothetical protein
MGLGVATQFGDKDKYIYSRNGGNEIRKFNEEEVDLNHPI